MCSQWDRKESDTTERLSLSLFTFQLTFYFLYPQCPSLLIHIIFSLLLSLLWLLMVHAQSLQLCPTLCDPMDCSLPGSSVHGIFQTRILEWVAISFSNRWGNWEAERIKNMLKFMATNKRQKGTIIHAFLSSMCVLHQFSRVRLFAIPLTTHSMVFSRPECWNV